jgi:hypothetical protein
VSESEKLERARALFFAELDARLDAIRSGNSYADTATCPHGVLFRIDCAGCGRVAGGRFA